MVSKEYLKKYYIKNKHKLNKQMKEWFLNHPHYHRDYWRNHPKLREKQAKYYRKWYKKNGRKRGKNYCIVIKKWAKENPEKIKIKYKTLKSLQKGILIKPKRCSACKRKTKLNAHHPDYNKFLFIVWLCGSCHKKLHYQLKKS